MGNSKKLKNFNKFKFFLFLIVNFLLFLTALIYIYWKNNISEMFILFTAVYLFSQILFAVFYASGIKKTTGEIKPMLGNITVDFIYELYFPIVIINDSSNIIWYNDAFLNLLNVSDDLYNKNMNSLLDKKLPVNGGEIEHCGKHFNLNMYKYTAAGMKMDIIIFDDKTVLTELKTELKMKEPVVAYIVVDNIGEIAQITQNRHRMASGEVSDILKSWMDKNNGILKEYEKDKYLCIFENHVLKTFVKNKFEILDEIRNIKIEDVNISVTVSAGISGIEGTLSEKDNVAKQALDMALQRGGDQAVIKNANSMEFFGGKTKTAQKKTKVKSRVVANQLEAYIKDCHNVLIMGHKFADNDSIGSCVGMARFVMSRGVRANIIVNIHDKNIKTAFTKLRGIEEYKDVFVDAEIAVDMINSDTFLIIVDANNPEIFEAKEIYNNVNKVAVIDHHRKTTEYMSEPEITYIEPSASSASELVAEILEQSLSPGELLKEEAELLLAGIILDTKQFTRNTGIRTFSAALYLRGEGGSPSGAVSMFKTDLEEFVVEAKFESNVVIYNGNIAISVLQGDATSNDKTAGAKAADRLLSIDGVQASFTLFKIGDTVHISARSTGKVNVQLILETLGGGGHYDVAGAQLKNTAMKDALFQLKNAIDTTE